MKEISQLNMVGPSSIAIEIREFTTTNNQTFTIENFLAFVLTQRKFIIGFSPRTTDFYGPFGKDCLTANNYKRINSDYETVMKGVSDKISIPYLLYEYPYTTSAIDRAINTIKSSQNLKYTTYVFCKNFFCETEKNTFFNEPNQYSYFISIVLISSSFSWLITIWYD